MTARDGVVAVPPLYAIADSGTWPIETLPQVVEDWARAGVGCIQLRVKGLSERRLLHLGRRCQGRLMEYETQFWINDSVRVARDIDATGVHLGQSDELPEAARGLLASHQLVGRSTHNLAQALVAEMDLAVDVVALGPIFSTASKANPEPVVGLRKLRNVCQQVTKPVVAIGGIHAQNVSAAFLAGATSVAMIGAFRGPGRTGRVARAKKMLAEIARARTAR